MEVNSFYLDMNSFTFFLTNSYIYFQVFCVWSNSQVLESGHRISIFKCENIKFDSFIGTNMTSTATFQRSWPARRASFKNKNY